MKQPHAPYVGQELQLGGIRTGSLDFPQPLGGQSCRVAMVDTGSGLRFTVALDRGGDITDAVYNDCPLAFATPNGLTPPSPGYQVGMEWLRGWAGGLVTTCGPTHIGGPQPDEPYAQGLHGQFSNIPASVRAITNPDPRCDQTKMSIAMRIADTRMFAPCIEIDRVISCELDKRDITIEDTVTNRGNVTTPHHWLYHCNLGYPLLSPNSRLVLSGRVDQTWGTLENTADPNAAKRITEPLAEHADTGEGGLVLSPASENGTATVGLVNEQRQVGLRMAFPTDALPRLAVWQHFGHGSYVCGVEPFAGSLLHDTDTPSDQWRLEPGESRRYHLELGVLSGEAELGPLLEADAPLR